MTDVSMTLRVDVPGRLEHRLERLARESGVDVDAVVARLVGPDRLERLVELLDADPPLVRGYLFAPGTRPRPLAARIPSATYRRLLALASSLRASQGASLADVVRYLLGSGLSADELDAEWRSEDPLLL